MIFIDTGAFLAKYLRNDQHHSASLPIWERLEREKAWICTSNFVIDELATLLARRSTHLFAAETIRSIYESDVLEILRPEREEERAAVMLFTKYADQAVSFTDCVSFALMRVHRIDRVFAFDRHFDLPGFARIPLVS